ncbi:MAG: hypothetical protein AAGB46_13930 [Verrucomicrobiota bacterium]
MIASSKVTEQAQERWDNIVERFRAACILHKQGRVSKSRSIIKEELPTLIKAWIRLLPQSFRDDAKADLRDMFEREQALVDQGWKLQRIFKDTLVKSIIPQVEAKIAAKYRAMYLGRADRKRQERLAENDASWVNPSYADQVGEKPRIGLDDVSGMIDSLQNQESEILADSLVGLDQLVGHMAKSGIEPLIAADDSNL